MAHRVDRLPCNQHRHHGGLPRTRSHFEGDADQLGVRLVVGGANVRPELADCGPPFRRDLGKPDHRLDGLDLTEKRADVLELVMPPMLEQPGGFRGNLPLVGIGQLTPVFDVMPDLVDDRGGIVFLLFGRETVPGVEYESGLVRVATASLWPRDRRQEL
jgi:hypothetical protein